MNVIEPARWIAQPWRNGAGTTHELVRWPDGERFGVRVSVADLIAPAPFSTFAGYRRWLYLLDGGPVTLTVDGARVVLAQPADVLAFAGEAMVAATAVEHPSRDLNVMVRADVTATVALRRGPSTQALAGALVAVFAIAGDVTIDGGALARHACAWSTDGALTVALAAGALAVTVAVEERP